MSIHFTSVDVIKTKTNFHYVTWGVEIIEADPDIVATPDDYYFLVYWSNDPDSGYHTIKDKSGADLVIDGSIGPLEFHVEHPRKQTNFNEKFYYKVSAHNKLNESDTKLSMAAYQGKHKDGVHEQIRFAENMLYNQYVGEPCCIVKRKSWGIDCPNCWSKERQQRTKSNCAVCNGTGKLYGYYKPIFMQITFDADPVSSDVGSDFETVTNTKRGRLSNFPIVKPRDLIVNTDDNKRYVITHVDTTKLPLRSTYNANIEKVNMSKQNYVLSQLLTMQEVCAEDQEYYMDYDKIKVDPADSSLPRFETHNAASGNSPIAVADDQTVSLSYTDDFEVTEDGQLSLKNTLDKHGILTVDYSLKSGFNKLSAIPTGDENLIPSSSLITKIKTISVSINSLGAVNDINPAIIRVAEYDRNALEKYRPGSGVTKYVNNFIPAGSQTGVRYYRHFNIDASQDGITMTPDKVVFMDIDPNDSWAIGNVHITLELELRMA